MERFIGIPERVVNGSHFDGYVKTYNDSTEFLL